MQILIVDDSKPRRHLVKRTMLRAGYEDHDYVEAGDGLQAMDLIYENQPDLILADWNMPNMNGLELLQTVRKDYPNIKLGFVTSEQTDEMIQIASENGALFTIGKPFTVEAFQDALEGLLP